MLQTLNTEEKKSDLADQDKSLGLELIKSNYCAKENNFIEIKKNHKNFALKKTAELHYNQINATLLIKEQILVTGSDKTISLWNCHDLVSKGKFLVPLIEPITLEEKGSSKSNQSNLTFSFYYKLQFLRKPEQK